MLLRRGSWKRAIILICLAIGTGCVIPLLHGSDAPAYETRLVARPDGFPLFALNFFDKGEVYPKDEEDDEDPGYSPWQLSDGQKQAVVRAAELWAGTIGPDSRNVSPLPISVGTYLVDNADASSEPNEDFGIVNTGIQDGILHGIEPDTPGLIHVGILNFAVPDRLSPVPVTGRSADMIGVLYHEMGHALGVSSFAGEGNMASAWDTHLYDRNGTRLMPGVTIVEEGEDAGDVSGGVFVVGEMTNSGVRFRGRHVAEVMGNDEGLLIEGVEGDGPDLAHIELEHSLMSHQNYRNYTTFMEAELAALQDIGYSIDRRNFFGYSVYGDDLTITSANGYFARNEAGTDWIAGQANTATLGVGLHIYGKRNTVIQAADLLAGGVAGTGIRVDGSNNALHINPDVLVAADGLWGTGLLVAYGKEQTVVNRGVIQALGRDGVAARFDFGGNLLGNDTEYRGSWMWTSRDEDGELADISIADSGNKDWSGFDLNLDGELVSSFDVSGRLAGSAASIYIAENAWVKNINILSGATISGDIISDWDPNDSHIQYEGSRDDLHTRLTFGLAPREDGSASAQADSAFDMTLYGSISGADGIDMRLAAGHLAVTGTVDVSSLRNDGHLTLTGMDDSGRAAYVGRTFVNDAGATLETGFTPDGRVAGIEAGSAELGGAWLLRPLPGFYADASVITPEAPVSAAHTITGDFATVGMGSVLSPTLEFSLLPVRTDQPRILVSRAADAYSRYAASAGAASLGRALAGIAGEARGDMRNLLAAADWSARDGSGVRQALDQLGPEAYDASARASLAQQAEFNMLLLRRMLADMQAQRLSSGAENGRAGEPAAPAADGWQAWAVPYGAGARQGSHGDASGWQSTGVGLLAGLDRRFENGLSLGFHAALSARRTQVKDAHDAVAETQSALVGVHGLLAPGDWDGFYLTAQARMGLEDGEMERNISFNGYARHNESRWTGLTGSALLGGGKDWTLSAGDGLWHIGPVGWLEYAFLRRPDFSESDGQASRLHVDARTYESLLCSLGAHAGWNTTLENGSGLGLDILTAWRHELLDGTFHTSASFRDYGARSFRSSADLAGRDALLVQGGVRLTHPSRFFAQIDAGGEFFRTGATAADVGLSFGWEF